LDADKPTYKLIIQYKLKIAGLSSLSTGGTLTTIVSKALFPSQVRLDLLGIGFTYRIKEMLCAPITSPEFEERLIGDITALKVLIKEVTLGAHAKVIDE
jgi:hypothetical protein